MFEIGDYAVCPGHGVGIVSSIEESGEGEAKTSFYKVKIISNGMMVMVPFGNQEGIRKLMESEDIEGVYSILQDHNVEVDNSTWNRRHREYMTKVKTGSLQEIAEVLRALFLLKKVKNLSFGEKKMLDQCRDLLAQEISITDGVESREIKVRIDSYFEVEQENEISL